MKRLVVVPNTCSPSLGCFTKSLTSLAQPSASDSSPKVIAKDVEDKLVEICRAIHNYSYDIFEYRVNKRKHKLSEIRGYIEQGPTPFTGQQHSALMEFLQHVDRIIKIVTNARDTKQLPYNFIEVLLSIYSYWKNRNLLPKGELADNKVTLLDHADTWLAEGA